MIQLVNRPQLGRFSMSVPEGSGVALRFSGTSFTFSAVKTCEVVSAESACWSSSPPDSSEESESRKRIIVIMAAEMKHTIRTKTRHECSHDPSIKRTEEAKSRPEPMRRSQTPQEVVLEALIFSVPQETDVEVPNVGVY